MVHGRPATGRRDGPSVNPVRSLTFLLFHGPQGGQLGRAREAPFPGASRGFENLSAGKKVIALCSLKDQRFQRWRIISAIRPESTAVPKSRIHRRPRDRLLGSKTPD